MIKYKALKIIAAGLQKNGIKYKVFNNSYLEELEVPFRTFNGHNLVAKFIAVDHDNDISIRIYGIVRNVPNDKRMRIYDAISVIYQGDERCYFKFVLDKNGDVDAQYDLPVNVSDESLGEIGYEILARLIHLLDNKYSVFMKALYSNEELDPDVEDICGENDDALEFVDNDDDEDSSDENGAK